MMKFTELTLQDFGVYGGRQSIDLSPISPERPVILVGGLNGRGKTTIIDAIQIALYGNRAKLSNRGNLSWDEYLRRAIHRGVDSGAAVTLKCEVLSEDGWDEYIINRRWDARGATVKETLKILINGDINSAVSDNWWDYVSNLMPFEVSGLHIFDGEKIGSLAEGEESASTLRSAINDLLGLSLAGQLILDLQTLAKKKRQTLVPDSASAEDLKLQADIEVARKIVEDGRLGLGDLRNQLDRAQMLVDSTTQLLAGAGGDLWEQRLEIVEAHQRHLNELREVEESLRNSMSGPLPLAIVRSSLTELHDLAKRESLIQKQRLLIEILESRDEEIISQISDPAEVKKIKSFLEKDQLERRTVANQKCVLDSSESLNVLLGDLDQELQNDLDSSVKDLEKLASIRMLVLEAERLLSSVPEHETIVDHLANQKAATAKFTELQEAFIQAEEKLNTNIRERDRIEVTYDRFLRQQALEGIEELEDHRVAQYAERSIETLQVFIEQSLDLHLSQIESAILSCFLELIGKGSLIEDIRIDKETMQMTLATDDNPDFPVERLSAGERQLLAIATLWGLTLTTGQQLPVVVDTPLGRLDSEHRKALVSRYFGGASHQVLLLSTDEEVDDQLTEILEPFISKKYILEYNDDERRTVISTGYFERQEA